MAYTINKYNKSFAATVPDGNINTDYAITLIGKNYAGYGEIQNENFMFLLENFASSNEPSKKTDGQIWYDSGNKKLKFFDGATFRTTGGAEVSSTQPQMAMSEGDFWWDSVHKQLWAWDSSITNFRLIGPNTTGDTPTEMQTKTVTGTDEASHVIIAAYVYGVVVYIISKDEFTLKSTSAITGFNTIKQGITLVDTGADGATTSNHRLWGTASNSEKLGNQAASSYVLAANASFTAKASFNNNGFGVGATERLRVYVDETTNHPYIKNLSNDTIYFQTTESVGGSPQVRTPMKIVGSNILPGINLQTNLGADAARFNVVYANAFDGISTKSTQLAVGAEYKAASTAASSGTIAARTGAVQDGHPAGSLYAEHFVGTATAAFFADLAEKYLADEEYEVGTVVVIGGEKEVTASSIGMRAIGAVSENPAYMMNSELEGGTYIALKGRVPVKVEGAVKKGDRLVAGSNGTAQISYTETGVFAIALENNDDINVKLVEAIIL